jgi:hypothetical protein
MQPSSAWRSRLPLFSVLGVVLAANVVLLVSYNLFYDDRFKALVSAEKELSGKYDDARKNLRTVEETEQRLAKVQAGLEEFFSGTLGSRSERIAPLIEEIYKTTRKARLRPKNIAYSEGTASGAQEIRLTFVVDGSYSDVKGLLAAFESSPSFLVVEGVTVTLNEEQPDLLHVGMSVVHSFRPEPGQVPRRARAPRPGGAVPARPAR